jgi:hypothetical protein
MSTETAADDDTTSGTREQSSSSSTNESHEWDVDDVDSIKPNTIVSDAKESIQKQKQTNESYNIHQNNDEKIVNKNRTSNGLSSNDPLDPTHPTQQGQDVMNNKSPQN